MQDLTRKVQDRKTGFVTKDRRYYFKTHKRCFVASEAVQWLMTNLSVSREKAITLGEKLRKRDLFQHVVNPETKFKDEFLFFRFNKKRKVIIVGGGFAGSLCAKRLSEDFDVTLIDKKNYFLCVPSLPMTVANPSHNQKIRSYFHKYLEGVTLVSGTVLEIRDGCVKYETFPTPGDEIEIETIKEEEEQEEGTITRRVQKPRRFTLYYEYLIIATGSRYDLRWSTTPQVRMVNAMHEVDIVNSYASLVKARSVAIIGGGPVGIETAGEIISRFPDKYISIISSRDSVLERMCATAHDNVKKYYDSLAKNLHWFLGEKVTGVKKDAAFLLTDKGSEVPADLVYCCIGFTPNTECLQKNFSDRLSHGFVKVKPSMLVEGTDNIFALGDIAGVDEEKLAQNADRHAEVAVKNIALLENHAKESKLVHYKPHTRVILVSLGPDKALIAKGDYVYTEGFIASKIKSLVEMKIMRGVK